MGDPREVIESFLLTRLAAITQQAGYLIPRDPWLVTRDVLDFAQTDGQRPALILILGQATYEELELGGLTADVRLPGAVRIDHDLEPGYTRATVMNQWGAAIDASFGVDRSCGGVAEDLVITRVEQPAIEEILEHMQGLVYFEVLYQRTRD